MKYPLTREAVIEEYIQKGYKQKDDEFRKLLESGPQERRWLGWAGAKVKVLKAVEGPELELCPTNWVYYFVALSKEDQIIESNEINFCGDDDVIDRLPPWGRTKERIESLRSDIQPYVPMYYI